MDEEPFVNMKENEKHLSLRSWDPGIGVNSFLCQKGKMLNVLW